MCFKRLKTSLFLARGGLTQSHDSIPIAHLPSHIRTQSQVCIQKLTQRVVHAGLTASCGVRAVGAADSNAGTQCDGRPCLLSPLQHTLPRARRPRAVFALPFCLLRHLLCELAPWRAVQRRRGTHRGPGGPRCPRKRLVFALCCATGRGTRSGDRA